MYFLLVFGLAFHIINFSYLVSGLENKKDTEITMAKLLDSYSNTQISNLNLLSKTMLKRMQMRNEQNTENLGQCYEQMGKYTRLNNKRRALNDRKTINENTLHVHSHLRDNQSRKDSLETQASYSLLKELNFYLLVEINFTI